MSDDQPSEMMDELYRNLRSEIAFKDDSICIALLEKKVFPEEWNASLFLEACRKGKVKTADFFLRSGVDIDSVEGKLTVLNRAVGNGNIEMVKFLLERGANPTLGRNLITAASGSGVGQEREAILKLLLEYGGNPNVVYSMFGDKSNARTVLDFASSDSPVRKILLEHDAKTAAEILKENPNVEIVD
jgi:ankyrin repeat protein